MPNISDADKMGMAALIASSEDSQTVNRAKKRDKSPPLPRPRPVKRRKITEEDIKSGRVSAGDANDEMLLQTMRGMSNGGAVRGDGVSRVKTKGTMC